MGFNCYIDESGDEGIDTGGSRWFVLGALIVDSERDLQVSEMVSRIKTRFGRDPWWTLHWSDIRKHEQKLYVCQELRSEQWTFSCVVVDKTHPLIMSAIGLRKKWHLYFYTTRLLLERLSWYARDHGGQIATPIFEYRSNMSYEALREYLAVLRGWATDARIEWDYLEWKEFKIRSKRNSRLLQAADSVCGAVNNALEYSDYGTTESRYITELRDGLYRRGSNLFSYGFKFAVGRKEYFESEYPFLNSL